jgi:hypothetical protein
LADLTAKQTQAKLFSNPAMSSFEREGYEWRETYFVFFDRTRRPTLAQVKKRLHKLGKQFRLEGEGADSEGEFETISLISDSDFAAVDLAYEDGPEVTEQAAAMANEFKPSQLDPQERRQVERLKQCDARLDLLHFENRAGDDPLTDADDEMLDPSALLLVLDAMVDLTDGVGIDPASGSLALA